MKMKPGQMKIILLIVFILQSASIFAQNDSLKNLTFSAYAELYYSYDFAKPANHEKPNFIYNHKRHNEINANLILFKTNYSATNIRANLGLMAGNYSRYNLSAEPAWARHLYEANIGVKLSKENNLWLDAGILPSHIGFESAISADCWTLTRSILAENSPYYETGIKLSYSTKKGNLNLAFLVLNGWQRVKKLNLVQKPSFGIQVNYKPSEKLLLNYSNFTGTDIQNNYSAIRTFHNLYMQFDMSKKLGMIAGFDIGNDKYNSSDYGIWYSPVLIMRYSASKQIKLAIRGEYYNDKNRIIIATNTLYGLRVSGISGNFDYQISKKLQFRIEGKVYHAGEREFSNNSSKNYSLTSNIVLKF
ncbi:Putative beta-barrel porin-2, OmpL-like. bbp2 [Daejeonella rubra]|uniref:Putative beta-barrel porin-2, OmpL-like. bbp2 n=2 Tax=Daejeonella rubra TaxID=990371 RepID=A0A1G9R6F8_9SPHI|nr:Putative beta-barrel porin-2, OmpL-like. bbp2 [Daejeonella rubra]